MQSVVALQRCISQKVEFRSRFSLKLSIWSIKTSKLSVSAQRKVWTAHRALNALTSQPSPGCTCSAYNTNLLNPIQAQCLGLATLSPASKNSAQIDELPTLGPEESPSETLVSALLETGYAFAVYVPPRRNLSHLKRSLRSSNSSNKNTVLRLVKKNFTLQDVLARYLRHLHPAVVSGEITVDQSAHSHKEIDQSILHTFDDESTALLHRKGYDVGDVVTWATILTTRPSHKAASMLMILSNDFGDNTPQSTKPLPEFLFLFFLRRREIDAHALRLLIDYSWDRLNNRMNPHWAFTKRDGSYQRLEDKGSMAVSYPKMSENTILLMIVRLLRYARKVWPQSLQNISSLLTNYVDGGSSTGKAMSNETSARLSFLYNKVLCLLAIPSSEHPYRSIPYHQRAQFDIIKKMNEFTPALIINRQGYRAIARVQLAHRKTLKERTWANLKSKSWPPWKEDEVGIDADLGTEAGISRAHKVLERMTESGYAHYTWEKTAKILSGWDTDNSPTIQTRGYLRSAVLPTSSRLSLRSSKGKPISSGIWAARIQTTRTVEEAWACFLSYKESGSTPSLQVYYRMFEKIAFDRKRHREEHQKGRKEAHGISSSVASNVLGDGKEVAPPPADPRDQVYVRKRPPTLPVLFGDMIHDGVRPLGRCLVFLLGQAESISEGVRYLKASDLPSEAIRILIRSKKEIGDDDIERLKEVPIDVCSAFIKLLCRFPTPNYPLTDQSSTKTSSFLHASRLVHACKPLYRPPWYSLLTALAWPPTPVSNVTVEDQATEDVLKWTSILKIVDEMTQLDLELDLSGFRLLCAGFEKAVLASELLLDTHKPVTVKWRGTRSGQRYWRLRPAEKERKELVVDDVVQAGGERLKAMFETLVSGHHELGFNTRVFVGGTSQKPVATGCSISLPRLLAIPAPAELHALVRALGASNDYHGILLLARWMSKFAHELRTVAVELKNGSTMMRRCMIAIRASLEGHLRYTKTSEQTEKLLPTPAAPVTLVNEVMVEVDAMEEWGGWPTDEEVDAYVTSFKKRIMYHKL